MRARDLLLTAPLVLLLAACTSSPSSGGADTSTTGTTSTSTSTTVPAATTTAPASPTGTTGTTTTTSSATGTTTAAVAACTTAPLTVAPSTAQGAAGTQVQRFVVTNGGSAACTVHSYPTIAPYGPLQQGGSTVDGTLPITVTPIPSDFGDLGGAGGLVTLAAGGTAVFFLKWTDIQSAGTACYQVDGFDFAAPQSPSSDQELIKVSLGSICGGSLEESQMFPPSVTG